MAIELVRNAAGRTVPTRINGEPAVPFRLKDTVGHEHSLEEYGDTWLWLVLHRHLY